MLTLSRLAKETHFSVIGRINPPPRMRIKTLPAMKVFDGAAIETVEHSSPPPEPSNTTETPESKEVENNADQQTENDLDATADSDSSTDDESDPEIIETEETIEQPEISATDPETTTETIEQNDVDDAEPEPETEPETELVERDELKERDKPDEERLEETAETEVKRFHATSIGHLNDLSMISGPPAINIGVLVPDVDGETIDDYVLNDMVVSELHLDPTRYDTLIYSSDDSSMLQYESGTELNQDENLPIVAMPTVVGADANPWYSPDEISQPETIYGFDIGMEALALTPMPVAMPITQITKASSSTVLDIKTHEGVSTSTIGLSYQVDGAEFDRLSTTQLQFGEGETVEDLDAINTDEKNEIIFIDEKADPDGTLFEDATANGKTVILIGEDESGIEVITETLAAQELPIDAIHIVSHGYSNVLMLGSDVVNDINISMFADQMSEWQDALTAEADINLWGCDVSKNNTALVDAIAELTGADVASSNDTTGASGDWDLENATGEIESDNPFSDDAIEEFDGDLMTVVDEITFDFVNPQDGLTYRSVIQLVDNNANSNWPALNQAALNSTLPNPELYGAPPGAVINGNLWQPHSEAMWDEVQNNMNLAAGNITGIAFGATDQASEGVWTFGPGGLYGGDNFFTANVTTEFNNLPPPPGSQQHDGSGTAQNGYYNFFENNDRGRPDNFTRIGLNEGVGEDYGIIYSDGNTSGRPLGSVNDTVATGGEQPFDGYLVQYTFLLDTDPVVDPDPTTPDNDIECVLDYTEGDGVQPIMPNVEVSDADGDNLATTVVDVDFSLPEDNFMWDDTVFSDPNVIVTPTFEADGTIDALTITGAEYSPAELQAFLRSMDYENTSEKPSGADRVISIVTTDVDGDSSEISTSTICVTPVNDAPIVDPDPNNPGIDDECVVDFVEGDDPKPIAPDLVISDVDSPTLGGLTLDLTGNGFEPDDAVAFDQSLLPNGFTMPPGVTVNVTEVNGIPTMVEVIGTATPAEYTIIAQAITFHTPSENPSEGLRSISWTVIDDQGEASLIATSEICVDAVADAPVITPPTTPPHGDADCEVIWTEGDAPVPLFEGFTFTDVDSEYFTQADFTLTGSGWEATDVITYDEMLADSLGLTIDFNLNPAGAVASFSIIGDVTPADFQALMDSVSYSSSSDSPSEGERGIEFNVWDNTATESNAGHETNPENGPVISNTASIQLCVNDVVPEPPAPPAEPTIPVVTIADEPELLSRNIHIDEEIDKLIASLFQPEKLDGLEKLYIHHLVNEQHAELEGMTVDNFNSLHADTNASNDIQALSHQMLVEDIGVDLTGMATSMAEIETINSISRAPVLAG